MERIQELLENFQKKEYEDKRKLEDKARLQRYKTQAVECEKRIEERRKLKHEQLLDKVAAIDKKLKGRHEHKMAEDLEACDEGLNGEVMSRSKYTEAGGINLEDMKSDQNSNYIHPQESEHSLESSLVENFTKLEDLQHQQTELESWYKNMSKQFEQEYLKFTDKYNEMKCKILQQKQYYLRDSQNFISALNAASFSDDGREQSLDRSVSSSTGGKRGLPGCLRVSVDHSEVNVKQREEADMSIYKKAILKQLNMDRAEQDIETVTAESYAQFGASSSHSVDASNSPAILNGVNYPYETKIASSVSSSSCTELPLNYAGALYVPEHLRSTQGHSDVIEATGTNELIDETLHISPICATKIAKLSLSDSRNLQNLGWKTDLSQRYVSAADEEQGYKSPSSRSQILDNFSNLSCSTPLGRYFPGNRMSTSFNSVKEGFENARSKLTAASLDRLGAVALGYLTRKLIRTDKVQTLIKTIKDTKTVLANLEGEKTVINKRSTSKVEQQFKANLQHELKNAQDRLYEILIESSSEEKIEIISRSRLAAAQRENNQYFKNRTGSNSSFSSKSSRLSSATKKSLQRRQEHLSNRRILTRPSTSPATRREIEGKRQRKSWDVRSLKPTLSESSPFFSERKHNRTVPKLLESGANNQAEGAMKPETTENLTSRKTLRKKQLAVNLNRKGNSTNG